MVKVSPEDAPAAKEKLSFGEEYGEPTLEGTWFINQACKAPVKTFGIMAFGQVFGIILTVALYFGGIDVLPVDFGPEWPFEVRGSEVHLRDRKWNSMVNDVNNTMWAETLPLQETRSVNFESEAIEVIYDGECLTRDALNAIQIFEDGLSALPTYRSAICQREGDGTCRPARSVLRLFDGTYEETFPIRSTEYFNPDGTRPLVFRPDPDFQRIEEILKTAYAATGDSNTANIIAAGDPDIRSIFDYSITREFNQYDIGGTMHCRSMFYAGYPLHGFLNIQTEVDEQRAQMQEDQVMGLVPFLQEHAVLDFPESDIPTVNVRYNSPGIYESEYAEALTFATYLFIGAAGVVVFGIMSAAKSFWIPFAVLLGMGGTWAWSNLIYRYVFAFRWYGMPQQVSLLVLGLYCTTNCFVLLEHYWDNVAEKHFDHPEDQLINSFKRTNDSVGLASFLGFVGFVVQCFSETQVVVTAGLFSAILIAVQWITFQVYYPAMLTVWVHTLRGCKRPAWLEPATADFDGDGIVTAEELAQSRAERKKFARLIWIKIAGHLWIRWIVLALMCVGITAMAIVVGRTTETDEFQPKVWHANENLGAFELAAKNKFGHTDRDFNTRVRIIFGLDELELAENCTHMDFNCHGTPVYDEGFDLTPATPQTQLLKMCEDLQGMDATEVAESLRIMRRQTGPFQASGLRPLEVKCFIQDMATFYGKNSSDVGIYSFPDMETTLAANQDKYDPAAYRSVSFLPPVANTAYEPQCTDFCDSYYRHAEFGMMNWISNDYDGTTTNDNLEWYVGALGGRSDSTQVRDGATTSYAGRYGSFLKYASFEVNLTIHSETISAAEGLETMRAWDDYISRAIDGQSRPLQSAFQTTPVHRSWAWATVKANMLSNVFQGQGIALALTLVILALYINNYLVAILGTICIAANQVLIFGIISAVGYDLGLLEAVIFSYGIAVSTNFVAHYATEYVHAGHKSRYSRAEWAMEEIGFGVVTGGIMSVCSGLFLLGSSIQFYYEFGVAFASIVGFAILCGPALFVILLGIIGPEGDDNQLWSTTPKDALLGLFQKGGASKRPKKSKQQKALPDNTSEASEESDFDPMANMQSHFAQLPPQNLPPLNV